jgi:hypothetical protein
MSRTPKTLNFATLLLLIAPSASILPLSLSGIVQPVQAQTESDRKAEAERLLNLCREHLSKNQLEAAIQSCQTRSLT